MLGACETNRVPSDFSIDFAAADAIAAGYFARGAAPAISYGIVRDGALVHAAGFGARVAGGPAPDADTVFRIASMSKSFTASSVMLLRDDGLLALDDPAEKYVPELAEWPPVTPDADRVTIRHLLTMTAGFPTDDPWGDRQQGLSAGDFAALLSGGVSFNWAPGTRFEYSNMGYAILGRVAAAASGTEYAEFVRTRLLAPLGMSRTGYTAEEFGGVSAPAAAAAGTPPPAEANLAQGYRRSGRKWTPVPYEPYGAFAPMGGVYSTVRDLATWVRGFASAFPPGDERDGHPVRRASRREMQLPQAVTGWKAPVRLPGGGPAQPGYYGFGLFVDEDSAAGRIVTHSGGYPGFGSNMRWHLPTGLGVIALGSGTYAPMSQLAGLIMQAIVPSSPASHVALAPARGDGAGRDGLGAKAGGPWPETVAAQEAVSALFASWDDAAADALFTENVALDAPYPERRHAIELVRSRIGEFRPSDTRAPQSDTPAHRRWWLTGAHGTVQAQIQLSPQRPPRVQSVMIAVPPAAGSALAKVLDAVVGWMNGGDADWPAAIPVAPGVDATLLSRRLRMAAVWAGACRTGACQAGDGAAFVAAELAGAHATVTLSLLINPATGELRQAEVTL
jgi:CubicO group peptidase (beta-lactamase class C family)